MGQRALERMACRWQGGSASPRCIDLAVALVTAEGDDVDDSHECVGAVQSRHRAVDDLDLLDGRHRNELWAHPVTTRQPKVDRMAIDHQLDDTALAKQAATHPAD